jgi:hypothetical protein
MATRLATSHRERRKGEAVSAVRAKAASGVCAKGRAGDACSEEESAKGTTKRSNRGVDSCEGRGIGAPAPANKLAARADKLNIIRAVKCRVVSPLF